MFDVKFETFFDRPGVIARVKKGTKSALSKAGAFVRQRAKTSIKPARKSVTRDSKTGKFVAGAQAQPVPGKPPRSIKGTLRRLIFFGYDANSESVFVGPKLTTGSNSNPTNPEVLEKGGTVTRRRSVTKPKRKAPPAQAASYRAKILAGEVAPPPKAETKTETYQAKYRQFPYMGPALEAEKDNFPELFTDTVK